MANTKLIRANKHQPISNCLDGCLDGGGDGTADCCLDGCTDGLAVQIAPLVHEYSLATSGHSEILQQLNEVAPSNIPPK